MTRYAKYECLTVDVAEESRNRDPEPPAGAQCHQSDADPRVADDPDVSLGPKSFYRALCDRTPEEIARIGMMPVSFTNQLYGDEEAKRRARVDARFVNNAMMATLMGAAISDGLEDGRVVSGVGGQYNFVAQAFALEGARSILTLEATRPAGSGTQSNIRWNYGHETIPRHLRDVIVTELASPISRANPTPR